MRWEVVGISRLDLPGGEPSLHVHSYGSWFLRSAASRFRTELATAKMRSPFLRPLEVRYVVRRVGSTEGEEDTHVRSTDNSSIRRKGQRKS